MAKKPYRKPEIKEVKLTIDDTLLSACRSSRSSKVNARGGNCGACRSTYRSS